ncbi:MAG: hypothetical protein R6U39_11875 [Candidatus Aegiribacteria sp.]
MNCLLLCSLMCWTVMQPDPSNVLQTGAIFSWAAPSTAGWSALIARDGVPVTTAAHQPLPGWGSFDSITVRSPLEAGVWAAGRWEMDFSSFPVPDSSFSSSIGLIQNTSDMNRYSAALRRPVISSVMLDISIAREDTTDDQRLVLELGDLEAGGRGWSEEEEGYALWSGWRPSRGLVRLTFAHLRSGGEYWEALGMWETSAGPMELITAGSASLEDDTVHSVQGHIRAEMPLEGMRLVVRGDLSDDDGDILPGGTAGLLARLWKLRLQAGLASVPGDDPRFFGAAGTGPVDVFAEAGEDGVRSGIQTVLSTGYGFLRAGASVGEDSLLFNGIAMPSVPWGEGGRLHGGVSWELAHSDTGTTGNMDARSMFTLGRFAFIFAVEDVLDEWRSYSFGVTWTFSDRREIMHGDDRE